MAIFKTKDRARRSDQKAAQQSAMLSGEETYFYSEAATVEARVDEAYLAYRKHMDMLGALPYSQADFEKNFKKRMKKAGLNL